MGVSQSVDSGSVTTNTSMYLYLSCHQLSTEVAEVTLADGCTPMLGSQTAVSDESGRPVEIVLEPAVWFKVLVLDSISIDCRNAKISWSSSVPLPHPELSRQSVDLVAACHLHADMARIDEQKKRLSESMYIGGECVGYENELDEVFDTVQELLESYASGLISTEQFRSGIFQQLHCYVLPSIKLSTDDLANLERVFNEQEKFIDKANAAILKQDARIESVASSMRRLRNKFITELTTARKVPQYSVEFADLLLKHLQNDVEKVWEELDDLQNAVQTAKSLNTDVAAARRDRDAQFEVYQKLLLARETLKEYLERTIAAESRYEGSTVCVLSLSSPKRHGNAQHVNEPLHNIYMEMHHKIQEEKGKMSALVDRKVLVISVKEAIRSAIDELTSDNETFGVDLDRTGRQRATDVLCRSTIPRQWLTMTEQISNLLTGYGELAQEFKKFTARVNNVCEAALYEKRLRELVPDDSSDTVSMCSTDSGILSHCCATQTHSIPMVAPHRRVTDVRHIDRATLKRGRYKRGRSQRHTIDIVRNTADSGIESDVSSSLPAPAQQFSATEFSCSSSFPGETIADKKANRTRDKDQEHLLLLDGWFGDNSNFAMVHDTHRDYLKKTIDNLKADIHAHFEDMCGRIQTELEHVNSTYYRKVWLCYESHFYEKTMPNLTQLYEQAYVTTVHNLREAIPTLVPSDLGISGSLAEHLLSERVPSSLASSLSSSSVSLSSLLDQANDTTESPMLMFYDKHLSSDLDDGSPTGESPTPPKVPPKPQSGSTVLMRSSAKSSDIHRKNGVVRPRPVTVSATADETDDAFAPETTSPHVKCVTVHVPNAVTVVYDRRTWPLMQRTSSHDENIECAVDALTVDDGAPSTNTLPPPPPPPPREQDIAMKPEWARSFADALTSIASVVGETSPLLKFQHLTSCLREINAQLSALQRTLRRQPIGACSDDLIDVLVVLLCNSDAGYVAQLYPHLTLLADLMPPFFEGGRYSFSLVQFSVAFQFIQDTLVMKKKKLASLDSRDRE